MASLSHHQPSPPLLSIINLSILHSIRFSLKLKLLRLRWAGHSLGIICIMNCVRTVLTMSSHTVTIVSHCVTALSSLSCLGKQQLNCVRFTWFYVGADQQDIDLMDFTINYTKDRIRPDISPSHHQGEGCGVWCVSGDDVVILDRQDCISPSRFPACDNGGSSPPPPPPLPHKD